MDWLRQLPIGQYVDPGRGGGGWLSRLDPRLKFGWTLAFLVTPILAGPRWRLSLVALLVLITLTSGLPARLWRRSLALWLALSLAVGVLAAFLPADAIAPASLQRPPGELRLAPVPAGAAPPVRAGKAWELVRLGPLPLGPASLGPLVITRRSALLGLRSATLLFTLIHSANLLLLTTAPEALVWAIDWFLKPFGLLGLPVERLGFLLLLSLRFLPLVQEELQNLLRAIATRAVNLRQLGWRAGLGLVLAVGERLLANVLLRAEQGAEALLARGGRWLPPDQLHTPQAGGGPLAWLAGGALVGLLLLRWRLGGL
ncbi:MAG: CbiQ family ECF transporter T component [Synechococcaceae cyanobacterium]|nr:CbiQ family ECF transporter T component [Synechococcaceae cyanobacterium]